jgi:hypothetical protein
MWRPIELWVVEAAMLLRCLGHRCEVVSLTHQLPLYFPGKFLVLISVRG